MMEARKRMLGESNPSILSSLHDLARTWYEFDQRDQAFAMMGDCIQHRQNILGPDHPDPLPSIQVLQFWEADLSRSMEDRDNSIGWL